MSLTLLNALLVLAGPFVLVSPLAVITRREFSRSRRPAAVRFRLPTLTVRLGGSAVAW